MKMKKSMLLVLMTIFSSLSLQALTVSDLRTENRVNPVGIDATVPEFSWKLESQERGVLQQSYLLVVTSDEAGQNPVWSSGMVESESSQYVPATGISLEPRTRYYWSVTVTDNHGNTAQSSPAYFETGLMDSGWDGAQWIQATNLAYGSETTSSDGYTISARISIAHAAAGLIFAAQDKNNFYMWQFNIETSYPRFRPHVWNNGTATCITNVNLTGKADLRVNKTFNVRIVVTNNYTHAATYIDDVLIDERDGKFTPGLLGMRQAKAEVDSQMEKAYFDDIVVTSSSGEVLFSEDFSSGRGQFDNGTPTGGRLLVSGVNIAWQKDSSSSSALHYAYEVDLTQIHDNIGLIFAHTGSSNYHMWQINTSERTVPFLRRHLYQGSSPTTSEQNITAFTRSQLLGHKRRIRIEVKGTTITTSIDGTVVDTYKDATGALTGSVGMRAFGASGGDNDEGYFDNVLFLTYDAEGNPTTKFSEDFEKGHSEIFPSAEVEEYEGSQQMHLNAVTAEKIVVEGSSTGGASMFRREIALHGGIRQAKWYTSAIGIYDLFINGQRVGHVQQDGSVVYDELKPGWTDYSRHVFYSVHDVTTYLREGNNALGAIVSGGWASGRVAWNTYSNPNAAFMADLEVTYEDMTTEHYVTDLSWACYENGPLRAADIYDGETYDARFADAWNQPGYDQSEWHAVVPSTFFQGDIVAYEGDPVRARYDLLLPIQKATFYQDTKSTGTTYGEIAVTRELQQPTSFTLKKGETVVLDMGQNFAGWLQMKVKGARGAYLKMRFGEMLNDNGSSGRGNDGPGGSVYLANLRSALASNTYILAGNEEGESYHPTHTFFGFRYCSMQATQDVEILSLQGVPVTSSLEDTGTFQCSNPLVNQLSSNILWGQRSNYLSIPTDCPQRNERLGWTADTQIYSRTGTFYANMNTFFHKWMQDMRDSQRSDGAYPDVAPHTANVGYGNGAWADAGIVVPWTVYLQYGDRSIIEENWESMEKYMTFLSNQASGGYSFQGAGLAYGDWLSFVSTDTRYVCVAYHGYDLLLMSKMARALSQTEGDYYDQRATYYENQLNKFRVEFRSRYFSNGPSIETQTALLVALGFDLLKYQRDQNNAKSRLRNLIANNNETLNTGFVGTGIINQTLSRFGLSDKAYNLLLQRNCPSWLYSVDQGATTMWERWNSYTLDSGFGPVSMNSFNHYAYGAVGEWLYRYVAGIEADEATPGFKHIILQPTPDTRTTLPYGQQRITQAQATYESSYGEILSSWQIQKNGSIDYQCTVPANTTATLYLPVNSEKVSIYDGDRPINEVEGIEIQGYADGKYILKLGSGSYNFTTTPAVDVIQDNPQSALRVTPNPATSLVHIDTPEQILQVQLHSMSGSQVLDFVCQDHQINVSSLPIGTYLLSIETPSGIHTSKLIKK